MTYPMVIATWHDAWFDFDQHDSEDCRDDYLVRTVGFLVGETATHVSLAQEILPDDDGFRAVTHIPRAVVETLHELPEELRDDTSGAPAPPGHTNGQVVRGGRV